ncbi:NAD-dependent epimerase/dehydratase family protein [Shewanella sp. 4_MG-2023]|uniref:NAD-dependent epimerase/dehydratase family protein n=1 Tax=Shewanella sp. 4_MG-2023 TaxID=3062652 RepID=UPI0026E3DF50|nr:NAD-dependent epimerase/dehydratase family protein [Shewanella sp. 4_MG-2023]MDO6678454.1 NAD-dependent epimerase/dehydratase family protein [Shewanella sp. 4_MG-2023]
MNSILITGASGFIGSRLLNYLGDYNVTALTRRHQVDYRNICWKQFDLNELANGIQITGNFQTIIHLAANVHGNEHFEYDQVNNNLTLLLAESLAAQGMRRFIFISSIGVLGSCTKDNETFNELSPTNPQNPYTISKLEAEKGLISLANKLNFELVIIRPPLVYGKNAPGNFRKLIRMTKMNLPLPFGMINNSRSYISVDNLASFISLCIIHPKAANEVFLIADDGFLSTKELLINLRTSLGLKFFLVPIPRSVLNFSFLLLGMRGLSVQLLNNLQVDNSKAKELLGWKPIETMKESLNEHNK